MARDSVYSNRRSFWIVLLQLAVILAMFCENIGTAAAVSSPDAVTHKHFIQVQGQQISTTVVETSRFSAAAVGVTRGPPTALDQQHNRWRFHQSLGLTPQKLQQQVQRAVAPFAPHSARSRQPGSTRRHLLQPPPLQKPPPVRQPPQITIQELLANIDVSADNESVTVKIPAVTVPSNDSKGEAELPPVVVNLKLSDLFPDETSGKKLLDSAPPPSACTHSATAAPTAHGAASSSSSSGKSAASMYHGSILPARRLHSSVHPVTDAVGSHRHLQQGAGSGSASGAGATDGALDGYLQQNPSNAEQLQQLSSGKTPRINPDPGQVTLCELFDTRCTTPGRRMLRGPTLAESHMLRSAVSAVLTAMLPMQAAATARATAAAAAAGSRVLLQSRGTPAGLDTWLQTADATDRGYVEQLLGRRDSSSSPRINDVVGSGAPRRAARRLLHLRPSDNPRSAGLAAQAPTASTGSSRALQNIASNAYSTWLRGASPADQKAAQRAGLTAAALGKGVATATIASAVGGDAPELKGSSGPRISTSTQGVGGSSSIGTGTAGSNPGSTAQAAGQQQGGTSDGATSHNRRQLLQDAASDTTQQQQGSSGSSGPSGEDESVKKWKAAASPEDQKYIDKLSDNSDSLERVPAVTLNELVGDDGGRSSRLPGVSIANNPTGASP